MKKVLATLMLLAVSQSPQAQVRIALLGVGSDMDLIERWAGAQGAPVRHAEGARYFTFEDVAAVAVAPDPEMSPADVASLVYKADAAVIVVDATQGPLPINREHIIIARQARVPTAAILLANVDVLHEVAPADAAELLELEAAEMRELLSVYELDGRSALLFHDSERRANAPRGSAGDLARVGWTLAGIGKRRERTMRVSGHREARGQVYLLTDAEANGRGATIDGSATMTLWSQGSSGLVEVSSDTPAGPGDVAAVIMRAQHTIRGGEGARFLLIDDERLVGIGVLTDSGS